MSGSDHFSAHAADYARYRPAYPAALFAWLAGLCQQRQLAWDCGTGNGQAAVALAEHFAAVHASDLSAGQIAQATAHSRVRYLAARAEHSGLADASCDLVCVAQALHWFCDEAFYAEVRRVLKPGGLLAAWTYTLLRCEPAIDEVISHFSRQVLGPWWPAERRWVDLGYAGMPFPFPALAVPQLEIRLEWTLDDLLAYLRTWSATQRCIQAGGADPTLALAGELAPLWGDPNQRKAVIWPLAILCGRKP